MAFRKMQPIQPITENYDSIRASYLARAEGGGGAVRAGLSDHHGFFLSQPNNFLTERFAGLDKLFYTLVQGIVEDPDFAVQKDSKIYEKMLRDPQIFYCLYVRKAAVSSLPWIVKPAEGLEQDGIAQSIAKKAEIRLKKLPRFSELLDNIQDALLPGLSINELVWTVGSQGEYIVKDHHPVNKDRVKFDKIGRLYLLNPKASTTGTLCPPYKFIKHIFNVTDGSWKRPETGGYSYYGRGLADTPLFHYFYFKMMAMKFMMKELERYGIPSKVIYTGPQNTALAEKLSAIMSSLRNDSVTMIPGKKGDVVVEVMKTTRSGNMFALFINYVDSLITKTILGQELMTEMPGVGSYAAAAVHKSVFGIINEQDRMLIRDTLNRTLMVYDAQLNTPNIKEEYYPIFDFKKSPIEDVAGFLETVESATRLGVTVAVKQVREFTGLREPLEGEETIDINALLQREREQQEQQMQQGQEVQGRPRAGERNAKNNRNRNAKTTNKKPVGAKSKNAGAKVSKLR